MDFWGAGADTDMKEFIIPVTIMLVIHKCSVNTTSI